jgi:hypothetical protein
MGQDEQAAQIAVTLFADAAEPVLLGPFLPSFLLERVSGPRIVLAGHVSFPEAWPARPWSDAVIQAEAVPCMEETMDDLKKKGAATSRHTARCRTPLISSLAP